VCDYARNIPGEYRDHNVSAGDYFYPRYEEVPKLIELFSKDQINERVFSLLDSIIEDKKSIDIKQFYD